MTDLEPSVPGSGLWSFFNLNLKSDSEKIEQFRNVGKLNGFEAWRRATAAIRSQTIAKRLRLQSTAWGPAPASKV